MVLLMLLLAIELCESAEHASNLIVVSVSISISISRIYKKTEGALGVLIEF